MINIYYISYDISGTSISFNYALSDANHTKNFSIKATTYDDSYSRDEIICNGIISYIFEEYRYGKHCPFIIIKSFLAQHCFGSQFSDEAVRRTIFYKKNQKVMDKILKPVAIVPVTPASYTGALPSLGYNGSDSIMTTTVNVTTASPMRYVYLNTNAGTWAL